MRATTGKYLCGNKSNEKKLATPEQQQESISGNQSNEKKLAISEQQEEDLVIPQGLYFTAVESLNPVFHAGGFFQRLP